MRLANDSSSFTPVHSQIRAIGPRDLHHAKGRGQGVTGPSGVAKPFFFFSGKVSLRCSPVDRSGSQEGRSMSNIAAYLLERPALTERICKGTEAQ